MTTQEAPYDQAKDSKQRTKKAIGEVTKVGNLGKDFELKYNDRGLAYAQSTLGVTRPVTPGDWKGEKTTDWYDIVCFREMAENAAECLQKGARVIVQGAGEFETWIDDAGEIHTSRSIKANAIGPDLRWATATVTKIKFNGTNNAAPANAPVDDENPPF